MADKFRTQDESLTALISVVLTIPAAAWFRRELLDLLHDMCQDYNWEQVGAVTVEEALDASNNMYLGMRTMIGDIIAYVTSTCPDNALPCDGTEYHRVDYPVLYAALDSAFIVDADHFIVPDLRGRTLIGTGTGVGLTPRAMGASGGEENHLLLGAEMPIHSHLDAGHIHSIHSHIDLLAASPGELPVSCPNPLPESTSTGNAAIGNAGGDTAHNNMQPYFALSYAVIAR